MLSASRELERGSLHSIVNRGVLNLAPELSFSIFSGHAIYK
jgi:hypothetical protein